MKVRFLKSPTVYDLAYFPGDVTELDDDELVAELFKNGIAEATNEDLPEGDEPPPPPPEGDTGEGDPPPPPPEIEDRTSKVKAEKR